MNHKEILSKLLDIDKDYSKEKEATLFLYQEIDNLVNIGDYEEIDLFIKSYMNEKFTIFLSIALLSITGRVKSQLKERPKLYDEVFDYCSKIMSLEQLKSTLQGLK
jgi:hypothetical protein